MIDELLHQFLLDGGQVRVSVRSGSYVNLPDHWWDLYNTPESRESITGRVLSAALACQNFHGLSVNETAKELKVPYHRVIKLLRHQYLGSIKRGRAIQVYPPSLPVCVQKMSEQISCDWF